jgi:hypothetical protein
MYRMGDVYNDSPIIQIPVQREKRKMNLIQNSRVSLNMEVLDMHTITRSLSTVRSEPKRSDRQSGSVEYTSVYLTTT